MSLRERLETLSRGELIGLVVVVAVIIVDVTGLVHEPGVYEFAQGERVIDAVERAGGARNGADLSVLNLAAPLTDGTQVVVPKKGAASAGTVPGDPGGTTGGLINVNTA